MENKCTICNYATYEKSNFQKHLKSSRNNIEVKKCLQVLHEKASSNENIMPAVIDAVENYCTLGEIADELRKVFGEYK